MISPGLSLLLQRRLHDGPREAQKAQRQQARDVLVPDSCYGIVLEANLLPMFDEIFKDRKDMTTQEIIEEVGRRMPSEDSLLYQCHANKVPIVVPGLPMGLSAPTLDILSDAPQPQSRPLRRRADARRDDQRRQVHRAIIIGGAYPNTTWIWWNRSGEALTSAYISPLHKNTTAPVGSRDQRSRFMGKVRATPRR